MRSRYTSYALGGYGEYLFKTWIPSQRSNLSIANLSLKHVAWKRLDILAHSQDGNHEVVEFNAYFLELTGQGQTHIKLDYILIHTA